MYVRGYLQGSENDRVVTIGSIYEHYLFLSSIVFRYCLVVK